MSSSVKEPPLRPEDRGHAQNVEIHGALFEGAPRGTDVVQRALGDCFFLASLASLAQRRPEDVEAAIRRQPGGTFAVRLFHRDRAAGALLPREVVVDDLLPEAHGQPLHAAVRAGRGLWVALFEKAYALQRGGYGVIDRGGAAVAAIESLTGRSAHTLWLDRDPDQVWAALDEAIADRRLTLASTWTDDEARAALQSRPARATARPYDPATFTYERRGLVPGHQYSLWALHGAGEARAVQLRNPWAYREPAGDGKDDGIFTVPYQELLDLFANTTLGG
jgi:hypothetical protein